MGSVFCDKAGFEGRAATDLGLLGRLDTGVGSTLGCGVASGAGFSNTGSLSEATTGIGSGSVLGDSNSGLGGGGSLVSGDSRGDSTRETSTLPSSPSKT